MNTDTKKSHKKTVRVVVAVTSVIVVLAFFFIRYFVIFIPLPYVDTNLTAAHVYKESALAKVIQGIPIPYHAVSTNYSGSCGYVSSDSILTISGKYYDCHSVYDTVYSGSANVCNEYSAVNGAMERSGYSHFEDLNVSCKVLAAKEGSITPAYVNPSLSKLGHGHGLIYCYFPTYIPSDYGLSPLTPGATANNFNCMVIIDTSQG